MTIIYYDGVLRDRIVRKRKDDGHNIRYDLFGQSGKKNKGALTLWPRDSTASAVDEAVADIDPRRAGRTPLVDWA